MGILDPMTAAWIALVVAGAFEWGWPVGLKLGLTASGTRPGWIVFSGVCMAISGALLLYAQTSIAIGTAYAVWTGIGAVGAFMLGVLLFQKSTNLLHLLFILLIITNITKLKLIS